jgi:ribosomal protein S18 acetylase RimI-like enzyme
MHSGDSEIIFEKLTPCEVPALHRMLQTFVNEPEGRFFAPHSFELDTLQRLADRPGADLYFVAFLQDASWKRCLCGYGLLRGWNEGFSVPSLGIIVHRDYRAHGFGKKFMCFLHEAAKQKGADQVRLTVTAENERAVALYRSLGYRFEAMPGSGERLVGLLPLTTPA